MRKQTFIKPGDKFNRLLAVEYSHTGKHYRRYFVFKCDCGNTVTLTAETAISGNTKSCGCLAVESQRAQAQKNKLPDNMGVINHIVLQYKRHAKARGIEFLLSNDEVSSIVRQPCHYCGIKGGNTKRTKNCREGFKHSGIDRVDSSKNYTVDNVVPCCGMCNKGQRATNVNRVYRNG